MKLELKDCWHIPTWGDKVTKGKGIEMKIGEGFFSSEKVLFFSNGEYNLLNQKEVVFEQYLVIDRLNQEKSSYIEYLQKEIEKNTLKVKELTIPSKK